MNSQRHPDLQGLKRKVGISPFTERIKIDSDGYSPCPFHRGDSDRSFHVVRKEDGAVLGTCFSECGRSWDAIDFVKAFDKVGMGEAIRNLEESNTHGRELPKKTPAVPMTEEKWATCGQAVTDADVAELAASRPHSATPEADALNILGFRITTMGSNRFIVAPYRIGKTFYTIKARNLATKGFIQENSLSQKGLFNIDAVTAGCDVYVVESELDAAILHEQGYTAVSVVNAKQKLIEAEVLKKLTTAHRIFLVGDNDTAGISCMDGIAKLLPSEKVYRMPLTDGKDVGEWAAAFKRDDFLLGGFKENWEQLRMDALASWVANHIPFVADIPDEPQLWTVKDLLPLSGYLLISGKYGAMKSLLALYLAFCIENGARAFGRTTMKAPVLYLDRENPRQTIGERRIGLGIPDNQVRYWGDWLTDETPSLDDPRLAEFAIRERGVIIFDSLQDWLNGANENDPSQMTEISRKFRRLARLGAGVIVLHHADKYRSGYRGTTAIPAGTDMALKIAKTEDNVIQLREERFRSCASWEMDVQFFFQSGADGITHRVLRDESPKDRCKAEAADERRTVCTILTDYHEKHDGAGMSQSQLLNQLKARGVSLGNGRTRGHEILAAGVKAGTWSVSEGTRNSVLYLLSGWKPESPSRQQVECAF